MKELKLVQEYCKKYKLPKQQEGKRALFVDNVNLDRYLERLTIADGGNIKQIAIASANMVYAILAKVVELRDVNSFMDKTMFETNLTFDNKSEALKALKISLKDLNETHRVGFLENMLWDIEEYISLVGLFNPFDRIFEEIHRCHMEEGIEFRPLIPEQFDPNKTITYVIPDLSFLNY